MIYTHVLNRGVLGVNSPADDGAQCLVLYGRTHLLPHGQPFDERGNLRRAKRGRMHLPVKDDEPADPRRAYEREITVGEPERCAAPTLLPAGRDALAKRHRIQERLGIGPRAARLDRRTNIGRRPELE